MRDRVADAAGRLAVPRLHRDVSCIAVGILLVVVAAVVARHGLSGIETDVFRSINRLPTALAGPTYVVMQAGALPAALAAAVIALIARRPRLAVTVAVAGVGAWVVAKWVKEVVGRGRPGSLLDGVTFHGAIDHGLGFPSGHAALVTAVVTVASPHLGRLGRTAGWTLVVLVATARIYVGAHLPLDVLGGVALGWTIATGSRAFLGAHSPRFETVAPQMAE